MDRQQLIEKAKETALQVVPSKAEGDRELLLDIIECVMDWASQVDQDESFNEVDFDKVAIYLDLIKASPEDVVDYDKRIFGVIPIQWHHGYWPHPEEQKIIDLRPAPSSTYIDIGIYGLLIDDEYEDILQKPIDHMRQGNLVDTIDIIHLFDRLSGCKRDAVKQKEVLSNLTTDERASLIKKATGYCKNLRGFQYLNRLQQQYFINRYYWMLCLIETKHVELPEDETYHNLRADPSSDYVELGTDDYAGDRLQGTIDVYNYGMSAVDENEIDWSKYKGSLVDLVSLLPCDASIEEQKEVLSRIPEDQRLELISRATLECKSYHGYEDGDPEEKAFFVNRYYWMLACEYVKGGTDESD